ncbi:hypothetical protein MMC26_005069 [Xylographa opegraphella]|nr:hypothetical protein [Xylographa opegraphella]
MPPQRTIPPAKAIKTERTHEENQERAYIAASRRSDRSLEARVESARRASEIHKRRTGRSLRVTEQDVVNEEMYEEEDDDLPMQYRRLTAHLQTGSADFNRRLAAYLTNHVAMRSALDQAITNSYAQQYPNAPQFAHNQQTMYPSPLMSPQGMQPQGMQQQSFRPPQFMQHQPPPPHPYRQSPYPTPGASGFRQHSHNSSSMSSKLLDSPRHPSTSPIESCDKEPNRRMSMPAPSTSASVVRSPHPSQPSRTSDMPKQTTVKTEPESKAPLPKMPLASHPMGPPITSTAAQQQVSSLSMPQFNSGSYQDFSPFTMSLPPESQMLLGSTLDPNDPLTTMFMAGSESFPQPYFNNNFNLNSTNVLSKQSNFHPSYDGMSATLAPSALHMSPLPTTFNEPASAASESASTSAYGFCLDGNPGEYKGIGFLQCGSGGASGTVTPGIDSNWDAFIDDNSWAENAT